MARELGFDMSKVNVNGGAIAWVIRGRFGARASSYTLLHEMAKRPEAKKVWPPCASAAAWALPPSLRSAEPDLLNRFPPPCNAGGGFFCLRGGALGKYPQTLPELWKTSGLSF